MNRREFLFLTAALPAAMQTVALAATGRAEDYLDELVKEGIAPGAALVASRRGSVKLQQAAGTCCRLDNREARLTLGTRHPLYSFSKLITGTVVAITTTEGRLDYGDRVSKHIPEFTGGGKDGITIRHCLTHAAGFPSLVRPKSRGSDSQSTETQRCNAVSKLWMPCLLVRTFSTKSSGW